MNVLEKILEEIKQYTKDVYECDLDDIVEYQRRNREDKCAYIVQGIEEATEFIRSHMDEARDTNVPSNDEIEPVSEEFLKDCAETAARYKRNFGNWIPVEERLPEKTDYYLVQLSRKLPNEDYSDRVVVLFNGEEKEFECYANLIIAWQPLPERYKGGDSNA